MIDYKTINERLNLEIAETGLIHPQRNPDCIVTIIRWLIRKYFNRREKNIQLREGQLNVLLEELHKLGFNQIKTIEDLIHEIKQIYDTDGYSVCEIIDIKADRISNRQIRSNKYD